MDICRELYAVIQEHLEEILSLRGTRQLKADNTFVSEGDLLCETLLFHHLKAHLTNYFIISEETPVSDLNSLSDYEYVITIDPIDGTENFVSGLKEWGIGVSVYRQMRHYQSMIALPELDICLCTGDEITRMTDSRICGLSSYMTSGDFVGLPPNSEYRIMGCCMYNMYNVIRGSYRQFIHLKGAYSWDILPGLNLALEHGLSVYLDGEKYTGDFLLPGYKFNFEID
ncbi:inositol monophosphatase family protein [Bacteroides sp.]|uniref:inositol monophosphatase family protein n=1 Tax=Bacteroides sp. TaxID=29523 RepID=UPI0025BA18D9|nr:inositol monophosphatase family protein [Bacteroides sp.]